MVHAVVGMLQLGALLGFAFGVYWLSQLAPRRIAPRVFKLKWLVATVGCGVLLFLLLAKGINLPARITNTPKALVAAHDIIREECRHKLAAQHYDDAYATISRRTKTAELVGAAAEKAKTAIVPRNSLARSVQPFLNFALFQTGVTVAFAPALLRLLLLLWQIRQRGANSDRKFQEKVRREWGVLLPIMQVVTLLSLCVSPTFYFYLEPGRAHRCIYTSGHWYTFTCTVLTFAIVITHLYRNRDYCRSCMRLLTWYFAWAIAYLAMALTVLARTQEFYHDSVEAVDGMVRALPSFCGFMVVLIVFQFLTASARDVGDEAPKTRKSKSVREGDDQEDDSADEHEDDSEQEDSHRSSGSLSKRLEKALPTKVSAKAKKLLGVVEGAAEDLTSAVQNATGSSSSNKKGKKSNSNKGKKSAAATPVEQDDEEQPGSNSNKKKGTRSGSNKASGSSKKKKQTGKTKSPSPSPVDDDEPVLVEADDSNSPRDVPNAPPAPPMAPSAPKTTSAPKPKRSTRSSAPPVEDSRDALLAGIQKGVKLKHAPAPAKSRAPPPGDFMGQLAARLAQARIAVDGEKDEKDEAEWSP